jgi:hypothetical protein
MKMKEALLLVLVLVPISCSTFNIVQLTVGGTEKSLYTTSGVNYFYMYTYDSTIFDLYFYLDDYSYGLKEPIYYCETDDSPTLETTIKNCYFYSLTSKSISGTKKNFRISPSFFKRYTIVKYEGTYSSGNLYAKCSYYDDIFDIVGAALSVVAIVGIVIGSIVFLSILITILCCVFRRRRIYGGVGYIPPQPAVVVTTPLNPY